MTNKTNGRYDIEFKKTIASLYDNVEYVLNLCKDYNLKGGTVYPCISQYSNAGASGNDSKDPVQFSNDYYLQS